VTHLRPKEETDRMRAPLPIGSSPTPSALHKHNPIRQIKGGTGIEADNRIGPEFMDIQNGNTSGIARKMVTIVSY
jgi:hypothetical protein